MDHPLIWAEINCSAIAQNIRILKGMIGDQVRLMAVVKADAYGHGAVETARIALQNGADALGVARMNEGIRLRKAGIAAPILIFGFTPPTQAGDILKYGLTQTIYSLSAAEAFSAHAASFGKKIKIHIKIDTGMGRLGLPFFETPDSPSEGSDYEVPTKAIITMAGLKGLELEGIFTHFASADIPDKSHANLQFARFMNLGQRLHREGLDIPMRHAANSAALITMPHTHLEMVRSGIAVYGLLPSVTMKHEKIQLEPAMALKAKIIHLKRVPAGFSISYGGTYKTEKPSVIATVPVGYADGFNRLFSSRGQMLVRGQKAPVVGRVCMDLTMLDVGHISDVALEDEVVILGRQGDAILGADNLATALQTINYEIVSTVMARVPRIYIS